MNRIKKIILFSSLVIFLIVCIVIGIFYYNKLNKVVSILTIDINPSIKVSLNYKNKVVKTEGLNEDGKELLKNNKFKGNSLKTTIKDLTKLVVENGYINEEDNHILINVEGKNIEDEVVTLIKTEFKNNNTECNIIIQEINEDTKENAEKYGISESKASYIESIIKENENIKFEDLKDKSINEINKIVKEQVEEEQVNKVEQNTSTNNDNQNTNNDSNNTPNIPKPKKVFTPPANDDRSGAWCDFIASLPPEGGVDYETPGVEKDMNKFYEVAKNYIKDELDWSNDYGGSTGGWYKTASYCSAGVVNVQNITKTKKYKLYIDSVTLEVLESQVIEIEIPTINEDGARAIFKKWVLDNYGVNIDSCNPFAPYYGINGATNIPEWQYSVKCLEPEIRYYAVNVNARTGELTNGRTWGENGF